jgi:hypothetical protein
MYVGLFQVVPFSRKIVRRRLLLYSNKQHNSGTALYATSGFPGTDWPTDLMGCLVAPAHAWASRRFSALPPWNGLTRCVTGYLAPNQNHCTSSRVCDVFFTDQERPGLFHRSGPFAFCKPCNRLMYMAHFVARFPALLGTNTTTFADGVPTSRSPAVSPRVPARVFRSGRPLAQPTSGS